MKQETTPLHEVKVRCETEFKQLFFYDAVITQAILDKAVFEAEQHERKHPTHQVEMLIWDGAPETIVLDELPIVKEMRARFEAGKHA